MPMYNSIPEFTVACQHANPKKNKKQYSVIERICMISISKTKRKGRWWLSKVLQSSFR